MRDALQALKTKFENSTIYENSKTKKTILPTHIFLEIRSPFSVHT